jgi:hypothetical protein
METSNRQNRVFAGQRRRVVINVVSTDEVVSRLANLPFWSRLTWNVTPLQSYHSTIERDSKAMENLKHSKLYSIEFNNIMYWAQINNTSSVSASRISRQHLPKAISK